MTLYAAPALFALFVWWFSTGVIMYLDGLPRRTFRYSMVGATALLAASFYGLLATRADTSVGGAYLAFSCGLLAWGWQEISFYMGFVTGPRQAPCPEGCTGWRRFGYAIQTCLWHELAIIAAACAVTALTWGGANQVGTWTFMVLWGMHESAKLNVFLGVRNLNEEFLPEHLRFLRSFLTKKPMNLLFPVSVTISTVILVRLIQTAVAPGATPFQSAGFCFLATLMGLAVLEHWFLVLPLPFAALWSWSLRSRQAKAPFGVEIVSGLLGAGETTFLRAGRAAAAGRAPVPFAPPCAFGRSDRHRHRPDPFDHAGPRVDPAPRRPGGHSRAADGPGFASWSGLLESTWHPEALRAVLDRLAAGAGGRIKRLKGVARAENGWLRFDLAGGRSSVAAFAPGGAEVARVVAIGSNLDAAALAAAFSIHAPALTPAAT